MSGYTVFIAIIPAPYYHAAHENAKLTYQFASYCAKYVN